MLLVSCLPIIHSWLWRAFCPLWYLSFFPCFCHPGPPLGKLGAIRTEMLITACLLHPCSSAKSAQSKVHCKAKHRTEMLWGLTGVNSLQFCSDSCDRNCRQIRKLHSDGFSLELVAVGATGTYCCSPYGDGLGPMLSTCCRLPFLQDSTGSCRVCFSCCWNSCGFWADAPAMCLLCQLAGAPWCREEAGVSWAWSRRSRSRQGMEKELALG